MTIQLAGSIFQEDKECIICQHVIEGADILGVYYDEDEDLQFSCNADNHNTEDWSSMTLKDILESNSYVVDIPDLGKGEIAERLDNKSDWVVYTE